MQVTETDPRRETAAKPFRRKVFYIPGYDPFPPRRYRELYRKEAAAQAAVSGYSIGLLPGIAGQSWRVAADIGGSAEAEVEVLVWSDIVQGSMAQGIAATYGQMLRTAWIYTASGALWRLIRLRKGPMIAALYPVLALILQAIVAGLVGWAIGALVAWASLPVAGWVAAGLAGYAVLRGFRALDSRIFAYYLMHDYAFTAAQGGAYPAALVARLAKFGACIRAALDGPLDEVLVVGHSSGAHLGVTVLADMIRAGLPASSPALGFLTLGQVVPMVSFLPKAGRLRGDLAFLSAREEVTWVDVTAPGDGCAFALCDPVAVSGVAAVGQRWPLVISAAFTQTLSPERWAAVRWRFFRLHFQYLCAFDRPGDYDYFQITAGPLTLGQRFRARSPSKSRITRAINPYRSVG